MIKVITQVERQSGTQEKIEGKEMEYNNRVFTALGTLSYNLSRNFCEYVLRSPELKYTRTRNFEIQTPLWCCDISGALVHFSLCV